MSKSREDIERLKVNWMGDPCWDIWTTEGFEEHQVELKEFQVSMEAEWNRVRYDEISQKAENLGFPNNLKLAEVIEVLEKQIEELWNRLIQIEERELRNQKSGSKRGM